MPLDFLTRMTVMGTNPFMISAALLLIMARDVSRAAHSLRVGKLP